MAQVTARVSDELEAALNRWAADDGQQRSELIRQILVEAASARREGRVAFSRPPANPADLQHLVTEVQSLAVELKRVLDHHIKRDAGLAMSARKDTIGISEARTAIVSQVGVGLDNHLKSVLRAITALAATVDNLPAVASLQHDLQALRLEIVENRASDGIAAKEAQAEVVREVRKRRALFILITAENSMTTAMLLGFGLMMATVGAVLIFMIASFFPSIAVPVATRLLRNDVDVCSMLDKRYGVTDCTAPGSSSKAITSARPSPSASPTHRGKRR